MTTANPILITLLGTFDAVLWTHVLRLAFSM